MDDRIDQQLVKDALSIATLGTQGEIALQIATNAVREARKHDAATITALEVENAALKAQLATVEAEALDRCAKIVEDKMILLDIGSPEDGPFTRQDRAVDQAREQFATAIRALKNKDTDHDAGAGSIT